MTVLTGALIAALIARHDAQRPRSRQTSVGPSELGAACLRRLAYRATATAPANPAPRDTLPAVVGTWAHTGMEQVLAGDPAWSCEIVCEIPGYAIPAHIDAYHHPTRTIVDWKFVGTSSLKKHRTTMDPQYRTQVHLYGFALTASHGLPVDRVAVCLIPRNGPDRDIHLWTEPYDETVVEQALDRWTHILHLARTLGPAAPGLLPTGPGNCAWCPWWNPAADPSATLNGCPGHDRPGTPISAWNPPALRPEEGAP